MNQKQNGNGAPVTAAAPVPPSGLGGDGDGNGVDARLRAVECQLAVLNDRMRDTATKEGLELAITKIKNWILYGLVVGFIGATGLILTTIRLFWLD